MEEFLIIDQNYPGLHFYLQENGSDEPYRVCQYDEDIISESSIEILMEDIDIFICEGKIEAKGIISCRPNLVARRGIVAGGYIRVAGSIHCCSNGVQAKEYIYVDGRIDVRNDIVAGSYIYCEGISCADGNITVGDCINVQTAIETNGDIDCGKRLFAGVTLACDAESCSDVIVCRLLTHGEVCAGQLIEGGGWSPEEGWC